MTNTETPAPISTDEHGNITFTGSGVEYFRVQTIARGLATKINSGGRMVLTREAPGRSVMVLANEVSSTLNWEWITEVTSVKAPAGFGQKRTNAGALADLAMYMLIVFGPDRLLPSTSKALGEKLPAIERKAAKVRAALLAISAAEEAVEG